MTRRLRTSLLVGLLGLVAAGCAIPTQSAPVSIAPSKVPFNLLDPHPATTTTTQPKSYVAVKVFFIGPTDQLQPAQRLVAAPAPLTSILDALMAGPTSGEVASNITSAIPGDVAVLAATTTTTAAGSIVTVNMNSAFGEITGTDTELAVGQIVATVAAENGNGTGVLFELDGQRTSVPVANGGSEVEGPVYVIDFL